MVNPIQNNEFPSAAAERGMKRGQREAPSPGVQAAGDGAAAETTDDRIQVSNTGRILNGAAERIRTPPATPEQAEALAARIRDQILTGSGRTVLAAHGGGEPGQLVRLLATPVT